jgi:hypothetical protein
LFVIATADRVESDASAEADRAESDGYWRVPLDPETSAHMLALDCEMCMCSEGFQLVPAELIVVARRFIEIDVIVVIC